MGVMGEKRQKCRSVHKANKKGLGVSPYNDTKIECNLVIFHMYKIMHL